MDKNYDLTKGPVHRVLLRFALPYLIACFLQSFYGMADLFVVGLFDGPATSTAVSIGSQVTHMVTVVIVGFAMGTTVQLGQAVGAKDHEGAKKAVGTAVAFFVLFALALTAALVFLARPITRWMLTPTEAVEETNIYLRICFAGVPFITAYNVISSIFRGAGDTKHPMIFVAIACGVNIGLDFLFIGALNMGAAGAALGTICGQAVSSVVAFLYMQRKKLSYRPSRRDIRLDGPLLGRMLKVGAPIAAQDGFVQIGFMVITVIANGRGLVASNAVGIVEKIISFLFLVPSAFLSSISAVTAQNLGAKQPQRAKGALWMGLVIAASYGLLCFVYSQFLPHTLVGLFTRDAAVRAAGCEYLRSYSSDCFFAGIHFCFSGYFCGKQKSGRSFLHNTISILLFRIPGCYLASLWFPDSLLPMGVAAPLGSLASALICVGFYVYDQRKEKKQTLQRA